MNARLNTDDTKYDRGSISLIFKYRYTKPSEVRSKKVESVPDEVGKLRGRFESSGHVI